VLIVEDNLDASGSLADLLATKGHRAAQAATGRGGIEAAAAHPPDVLVCDIGLPDLPGYDVIRAVRAQPAGRDVYAVALTGYAQPHDRELAAAAGFDAHLAKPAPEEQLDAVLFEAARRKLGSSG
jgi:CheY-like chemotaxis protein